jgi:hypothetical protein
MKEAIRKLRKKVQQNSEGQLKPASPVDLKRAQAAGFPDELIEFYRENEPDPKLECIELKQRIWSIDSALVENQGAVPGCALFPHGYVVFASNLCGDSYCIDTNVTTPDGHHPVVLFPHDAIREEAPLSKIQPFRLEVASSLEDFLLKFTDGTLIDEPNYC